MNRLKLRRQGTWTYEDWLHFPDDGWKYEIIDGVLYMTPLPIFRHQEISGKLLVTMSTHAEDNDLGEVLNHCGVWLPDQPVPFDPDLLFIKKEHLQVADDGYLLGPPDLIVEILSLVNPG